MLTTPKWMIAKKRSMLRTPKSMVAEKQMSNLWTWKQITTKKKYPMK